MIARQSSKMAEKLLKTETGLEINGKEYIYAKIHRRCKICQTEEENWQLILCQCKNLPVAKRYWRTVLRQG